MVTEELYKNLMQDIGFAPLYEEFSDEFAVSRPAKGKAGKA